jgi:hypothetical protein
MSLDINLQAVRTVNVFYLNVPTCYKPIAEKVGIQTYIWKPEELGISKAEQLINPLRIGLQLLESVPGRVGVAQETLDDFVECVRKYLAACEQNPDAEISTI